MGLWYASGSIFKLLLSRSVAIIIPLPKQRRTMLEIHLQDVITGLILGAEHNGLLKRNSEIGVTTE